LEPGLQAPPQLLLETVFEVFVGVALGRVGRQVEQLDLWRWLCTQAFA
jgi:hypothetical protein